MRHKRLPQRGLSSSHGAVPAKEAEIAMTDHDGDPAGASGDETVPSDRSAGGSGDPAGASDRPGRLRARTVAMTLAAAATVAVVVSALWLTGSDAGGNGGAPGGPESRDTAVLPTYVEPEAGWRRESYRGVELQVPADWGYFAVGPDWCAADSEGAPPKPRPPGIGRPGAVLDILCSAEHPPPNLRSTWARLDVSGEAGAQDAGYGWVKESKKLGAVTLTVFSDNAELRSKILGSMHPVDDTDGHGCEPSHPASVGRDYRPDVGTGGLDTLGAAESISVCRYSRGDIRAPKNPIISSSLMTGAQAQNMVDAINKAPEGSGPNESANCSGDLQYGDEVVVLRVRGGSQEREVLVRYSGCDGNGVDDGVRAHRLTAEVLRPVLSGPNRPTSVSSDIGQLIWPR